MEDTKIAILDLIADWAKEKTKEKDWIIAVYFASGKCRTVKIGFTGKDQDHSFWINDSYLKNGEVMARVSYVYYDEGDREVGDCQLRTPKIHSPSFFTDLEKIINEYGDIQDVINSRLSEFMERWEREDD